MSNDKDKPNIQVGDAGEVLINQPDSGSNAPLSAEETRQVAEKMKTKRAGDIDTTGTRNDAPNITDVASISKDQTDDNEEQH
jgi:hypothetical protein